MFGLFKKKKKTVPVTACLNVRLMPIDRGDVFEDPLDEWLQEQGLGDVDGGGCGLCETREIAFCDVEMNLKDASDEVLNQVIQKLEEMSAPKGSSLKWEGSSREFGTLEGMGIYLNGTDLPDEVYASNDVNQLIGELAKALEGKGEYFGGWDGPTETGLYCYGPSFQDMRNAVSAVLESEPLAQASRIEQIA